MHDDPQFEIAILQTVYSFYQKLLREVLRNDLPVPIGLDAVAMQQPGSEQVTIALLRRWLRLLDLAITPQMLRHGMSEGEGQQDTGEALLRYVALKAQPTEQDRDKLDFAATFLYRHPRVAGQWESKGLALDGMGPLAAFEISLLEILHDVELPIIPEEHVQLLRELESLREQVARVKEFDSLMDSGVIAVVREMKHALGASFYHPHVLAALAGYNAFFGKKFDELFREATKHIKSFAQAVQEQGGSSLSPVEDDLTVQHLEEVQEHSLLKEDYRQAQESFRHVSKLKRAVDRRTGKQPARRAAAVESSAPSSAPASAAAAAPARLPAQRQEQPPAPSPAPSTAIPEKISAKAERAGHGAGVRVEREPSKSAAHHHEVAAQREEPAPPSRRAAAADASKELGVIPLAIDPSQRSQLAAEEGKLRSVEASIRAFVRAADPRFRHVVPMRFGNLVITAAEADAYCADHLDETSFRADNARSLVQIVAVVGRIATENFELDQKRNYKHLWKPHADSLMFLVERARSLQKQAAQVIAVAEERGLKDKVNALNASITKLRESVGKTVRALSTVA